MPSHLSVHSTTFPLMPAPRTLLPTKNSSSKGVVLTTRGGCGLGKFGPLLPILEEIKPTKSGDFAQMHWGSLAGIGNTRRTR